MKVFADAIGAPVDGRDHLIAWGSMVFNGMRPRNELFDRAMANADEVEQWVTMACQRENLTNDGLGALVCQYVDANEIDARHAALLVRFFLSAGIDTTTYAIANALYCFATHPEQWDVVRSGPARKKDAFEEMMRRIKVTGTPVCQLHNTLRGFERLPLRFHA
ncbi:MAG TPA: hypothetical protein VF503_16820 [Sphingobium sp.]|uniref:hypothetical protein n=1 Tax=Sphingobium sp. TaxID=1912891 RepID=UPI002ED654B7